MLGCFAGCSGQKTLTGQITALEGQNVTVQLGTLSQDTSNGQGDQQGTPPAKPEGENDTSAQQEMCIRDRRKPSVVRWFFVAALGR